MTHESIKLPVRYRSNGVSNNNFQPVLTTYILSNSAEIPNLRKRPFVLICPGGAYRFTTFRESEPVAIRMNALGFHAAVLEYSCAPMDFPAAYLDLCEAVNIVRSNSDAWCIDTNKIIVCGFSAGGHLAASLGVWWNKGMHESYIPYTSSQIKPNALLLCYPVITSGHYAHKESIQNLLGQNHMTPEWIQKVSLEKEVNKDVPPSFVWHTFTDESVPVQNSLLFVSALAENGIMCEYHMFAKGAHGLSLATSQTANRPNRVQPECTMWPELFAAWTKTVLQ